MKLKFKKTGNDCNVMMVLDNNSEIDFSYVELVRLLSKEEKIDSEVIYDGDFSDKEKESIDELIIEINRTVDDFFSNDSTKSDSKAGEDNSDLIDCDNVEL